MGAGNPGFLLYLWSLPRGVQAMYAGSALVCLVCAGTGRSTLGGAAITSLLSSLLVLMTASARASGTPG